MRRLASGPNSLGVFGRRVGRAFLGRLASGPNPLGVSGRRVGRAFLGRLASGPNPFGALGLGRLARGARPRPKVPIESRVLMFLKKKYPSFHGCEKRRGGHSELERKRELHFFFS